VNGKFYLYFYLYIYSFIYLLLMLNLYSFLWLSYVYQIPYVSASSQYIMFIYAMNVILYFFYICTHLVHISF